MTRRTACVLLAVATGIALSACGGDEPGDAAAVPTTTPAASAASAATAGWAGAGAAPAARRSAAPLVGGGEVDLAGYAGQPVLLWFWAPY
jgi:hypothetical protein